MIALGVYNERLFIIQLWIGVQCPFGHLGNVTPCFHWIYECALHNTGQSVPLAGQYETHVTPCFHWVCASWDIMPHRGHKRSSAQLYKACVILTYFLHKYYINSTGTRFACVVGVGEQYADKYTKRGGTHVWSTTRCARRN